MITLSCWLALSGLATTNLAQAEQAARAGPNSILLEVFTRGDSEISERAEAYARQLGDSTPGLRVKVHDVLQDSAQLSRIWKLAKAAGRDKPVVPMFRCCNQIHFGFSTAEKSGPRVRDLYTAHVYARSTCPRCQKAKAFLTKLNADWPALRIQTYEITRDAQARQRWNQICRDHGMVPGLPTFHFAGRVIVGYQSDDLTGSQYERLLDRVGGAQAPAESKAVPRSGRGALRLGSWPPTTLVSMLTFPTADQDDAASPEFDDVPLPEEATDEETEEALISPPVDDRPLPGEPDDVIVVPVFGELSVSRLGLPVFTFLVGLVDGFNPCAMWVLVFLLSVLVNIKDRRKILLIAGTFVVVSGLAYFVFMAAWLNLLVLVGMARWIQLALGMMAITIGVVNIKDFFAFKKGISFSIPESSKPGIYARVRQIVTAKYLTAALTGAVVLAVVVNVVELICTAGLPALFTQILMMHELPTWQNYAYLALYISAYMLDDAILLTIVVTTLSHRRLQEREGRWLKLVSGLVILGLGLVMIFKPTWLHLGQ